MDWRIEELLSAPELTPFPEVKGVVPVPALLLGFGFFPGGEGLYPDCDESCLDAILQAALDPRARLAPMPVGGVMVVGHDYHTFEEFNRRRAERVEAHRDGRSFRASPVTRNLLPLLHESGVSPKRCFFTNFYMGLRDGGRPTGKFPGADDSKFVERNRDFFLRQLSVQRPRVVLTLGQWVPECIAPLAPQLSRWLDTHEWQKIDAAGLVGEEGAADEAECGPVAHDVTFPGAPSCSVVALRHPSCRRANVRQLRYGQLQGHEAEVAMIREAVAAHGLAA